MSTEMSPIDAIQVRVIKELCGRLSIFTLSVCPIRVQILPLKTLSKLSLAPVLDEIDLAPSFWCDASACLLVRLS